MSDLDRIAMIRSRRAERAMRAQNEALSACDRARTAVADASDEIQTYAAEIQNLEFDLLTQLVDKACTQADIMDVQTQMELAHSHAERLANQLRDAQKTLTTRELSVEFARASRARAERKLTKITEMNASLHEASKKEEQAAEDAEIDTFADSMPRGGAGRMA